MKIGIFTFMQSNYGAVLQATALRLFLVKEMGADVEVVNFTTDAHLADNKIIKKRSSNWARNIYYLFFSCLRYKSLNLRKKRTEAFKEKYLNLTKRYATVKEVIDNPPFEDVYITGSDQVFNPGKNYMPVYYLGFDKKRSKKIAYAPSFGISVFSDDFQKDITPFLNDFDSLSCREENGASFISRIINKPVPTVLDPVTLLSKEDWDSIAVSPKYDNDYIFIYNLNGGYDLVNYAKKLKEETGLRIICLASNITHRYNVDLQLYDLGPAEFLGYIKNARYVITDSFHGTMFSLIFEKKFSTYISTPSTSSRIINILTILGLKERVATDASQFSFSTIDKNYDVDFSDISHNSKEFLLKSCRL